MPATVTSSQQRRFMQLRRGDEPDPFAGIGAVVAALRGLTSVAAEGAAKTSAEESASRPPMEVKARVTNDGKTLFDLKNLSTDGDPQELAQTAYDEPNERFAQKFMNLRRDGPTDKIGSVVAMLRGGRQDATAPPQQASDPSIREMASATATDLGLPSPDRDVIDSELQSFGGQYRAQRDAGANPFKAVLKAAFVKALPGVAEDAVRTRQADAQVQRRVLMLGHAYNAVAPIAAMYERDQDDFISWVKHMDSMDASKRDDVMQAISKTPYTQLPEGTDPYAYTARLANLPELPEAFRPLVDATISEQRRKLTDASESERRAEKRDERAEASAVRAEDAAVRAANAETRAQERFTVAMQKIADATKEKPYKFAIGDAEVMQPEYLVSRIGDEASDQPSLERALQRQLKKTVTSFDTLTAERKALSSRFVTATKQLEAARARVEKYEYAPGAVSRVTQLETELANNRKRQEQIDALRQPMVTSRSLIENGLSRFSVSQDEWDALLATGETADSLKRQGIRLRK